MAAASKMSGRRFHVWVVMGDGEQQKGQIDEARRFATKYGLRNITVFIDLNRLQISGETAKVMPQDHRAEWASDGWLVEEIDGHDVREIHRAARLGLASGKPLAVLCRTVMGKGYSKIENDHNYHGKAVTREMLDEALRELGLPNETDAVLARRKAFRRPREEYRPPVMKLPPVKTGAWGAALMDIAKANAGGVPIAVFDCDLASSVRTTEFEKAYPDRFFQCGIQEHHAAACAGALSTQGALVFFSDFAVFGVDEAYNQNRLNDINGAQLKIVCTHCGLDVGEDGKTHQCIDYVGVFRNFYGFRTIIPADANQTDRAVRYAAAAPGPFFVGMGRSKIPMVATADGRPLFASPYEFRYGKAEAVREGDAATVIACGQILVEAVKAADALAKDGLGVKVLNMACLSDPDAGEITAAARRGPVVTVEDHNVRTGLGSIVAGVIASAGIATKFAALGISRYAGSGTPEELYAIAGIDAAGIAAKVRELLGHRR
jgi:transketolase